MTTNTCSLTQDTTLVGGDTKLNHGEHVGLQHEPCSENGEYLS